MDAAHRAERVGGTARSRGAVGAPHVTLCAFVRVSATRRALVLLLPVQIAVDGELAIQAQEQQVAAQGGASPKAAAPAS